MEKQENGHDKDQMLGITASKDSGLEIEDIEKADNGTFVSKEVEEEEEPDKTFLDTIRHNIHRHRRIIKQVSFGLIHVVVGVYFGFASNHYIVSEDSNSSEIDEEGRCWGKCGIQFCDGYGMLVLLVGFIYFGLFYYFIFKPYVGKPLYKRLVRFCKERLSFLGNSRIIKLILVLLVLAALAIFLYFETKDTPEKLTSLTAPVVFLLCGYIFSTDRQAIKWRPVILGLIAQFLLGVVCIRWEVGRSIFQCLGDKVATFLHFTNNGSKFVFGDQLINDQIFAFAILPVIFFFSFFISILYYLKVMQWVIMKLGWILQTMLGTTVCESVIAAANIFLGMSESPLLVRPYLKLLTHSELHAIMSSGFATVSGTVLAAYMSFGADPALLITSSVMAAPGALAIAKLYFPESEESKTKSSNIEMAASEDSSILDAASKGAANAIEIVLGIIANLVAFVSFIAFINAVVAWLAYLVGQEDITFEWIFAKLFIPLAWMLGIEWADCDIVAKVIASKTIINEFVAYERLGHYKDLKAITPRSVGITTFAICGFANPSSLGILIGTLSAMAPQRRSVITGVAVRAFIVGCIICFMSASFAGLLITEEMLADMQGTTTPAPSVNSTQSLI
ncbi:unnamed protein product [Hermetia illucens]|uniref:Sodium/nucleoside cotransporter n=1 Tax=Hermetia illucens TaxID=343691 RepID=A0A7R8UB87_HERIL|nr:sodium/nucleoside cotransporter 1 [Hermetia illucens]XP_037926862.1 sodium/nucleoside cotransporter 1 [Hermetia illucens]XP_037926863.1 sodium/nucleoside cotransporter 1 [Hermetia illucens]CAD7077356.1 unnamed protein product [Hermetia illucens]